MSKLVPTLVAVLSLSLLPVGLAAAEEVDLAKAKATFEATCGQCHGLDKPMGQKGRDKDWWTSTVKRMSTHAQDSFGKPLSADDQASIVEYLVRSAGK